MSRFAAALQEEISRMARKEVKSLTAVGSRTQSGRLPG